MNVPKVIHESDVEENVLAVLADLGYTIVRGDNEHYLPGGRDALRVDYKDVVLVERLRQSLSRVNFSITEEAKDSAVKQVLRSESQKLIADNEGFHRLLVDGIDVPFQSNGTERYQKVWLFDFENPENNDFLATNQFTVIENDIERRPDVILFLNGIPLLILELENLADEDATIWTAYDQFQTYQDQLPSLFRFNEILVISDGIEARAGTISSEKERFMQWKTIDGGKPRKGFTEIEILLRGMCEKRRLLDIARNFIVFEKEKIPKKKLAAYHQYWAANKALEATIAARKGNRKAGIVWHTQGSGKSLTMIF